MDPLSVAGSVLAVLTAAGKTSQGLERLYSLKDAPKELMCLINEVSSMRTMLKMVELLLVSLRDEDSTSLRSALHELDALHNQASAALHDLDTLIANKLKKPGKGSPETLRASSTGFLRERTTLGQMQQRFASITRSLSMGLTILNSIQIASRPQRDAVHLHVSIQSVSLANNELSVRSTADPDPLHVQLERALQGSAGPLARIAQLPAAQESAPESAEEAAIPKQAAPSSDIGGSEAEEQADLISNSIHSPPETVRLVTTIDSQKCQRFCQCQCHIRSRVQSPKWSKDILGSLYYQSNGAGWLNRRECNFRPCKRSGKTSAQITFYAPTWLMKTALYMSAVRDNRGGMNGSLAFKTPRVIPPGSMVWGLIAKGAEEQLVRYFHEGRASIYDVDIDGESLLHYAAATVQPQICRRLISLGADPLFRSHSGMPAFEYGLDHVLANTPYKQNLPNEVVEDFFSIFGDEDSRDSLELTALHRIVLGLSNADLRTQLELSVAEIDTPDAGGRTPVMWAARRADAVKLLTLIEFGANVNKPDHSGVTPLHKAAADADDECVRILLQAGANAHAADEYGTSALHNIFFSPHIRTATIDALLEHGADPSARNYNGITPLHWADSRSPAAIHNACHLVLRGADIDAVHVRGCTPVMFAVVESHTDLVRSLIKLGANLQLTRRPDKTNILHLAAWKANVACLEVLVDAAKMGRMKDVDDSVKHDGHSLLDCMGKCRDEFFVGAREDPAQELELFKTLLAAIEESRAVLELEG